MNANQNSRLNPQGRFANEWLAITMGASAFFSSMACDVPCGEGAVLADGVCVAASDRSEPSLRWGTAPTVTCGPGTLQYDGTCYGNFAVPCDIPCGMGTRPRDLDGKCIPDLEVVCGEGTLETEADEAVTPAGTPLGFCFPDINELCDDPCGADTAAVDGSCQCFSCPDDDHDDVCNDFDV